MTTDQRAVELMEHGRQVRSVRVQMQQHDSVLEQKFDGHEVITFRLMAHPVIAPARHLELAAKLVSPSSSA
jgi:hypothetical protein